MNNLRAHWGNLIGWWWGRECGGNNIYHIATYNTKISLSFTDKLEQQNKHAFEAILASSNPTVDIFIYWRFIFHYFQVTFADHYHLWKANMGCIPKMTAYDTGRKEVYRMISSTINNKMTKTNKYQVILFDLMMNTFT